MLWIDWDPTLTPPHQQYVDNWGEPERDHIDHDNVPRRRCIYLSMYLAHMVRLSPKNLNNESWLTSLTEAGVHTSMRSLRVYVVSSR